MIDEYGIVDRSGKSICPLQNVEVAAVIQQTMVEVTVTQNYINSGKGSIEALYTFPLPHGAEVTGFVARTDGSQVIGEFRESEKAFREYDSAIKKGHSAFLLDSLRPDIFQVSLGNIAKGESVSITISYIEELEVIDNELRWVLPTVVAPRYMPKGKVDYVTPPIGEAPYTLRIRAVLKGMQGLKKVSSPSHPIDISMDDDLLVVELARCTELLDSDFVLSVQFDEICDNVTTIGRSDDEVFGYLVLRPEMEFSSTVQKNYEYSFLIDISGSMAGDKLEQAKRALSIALRNLVQGDFFNIIAFESTYIPFSPVAVPYSQRSLDAADRWISSLRSRGGTEIYDPLKFVLEDEVTDRSNKRIVFLFTDGQIGNEKEIISLTSRHADTLSVFPFGIDTAVNKYFIDELAKAGNGIPEYIYPGERIEDKVVRQISRIHEAHIHEPELKGNDGEVLEVVPKLPSHLCNFERYSFSVRAENEEQLKRMSLCGQVDGKLHEFTIDNAYSGDGRLLSLKWAKETIRMLEEEIGGSNPRRDKLLKKQIVELSIKYGVLSPMTSLVAVHKRTVKETGKMETVVIPVAKPRGWEMPFSVHSPMPLDALSDDLCLRQASPAALEAMPPFAGDRKVPRGKKEKVHEVMRLAAEKQNADGSFGSGSEVSYKTSCFVLGMLLLKDDWRPFKVQISKAGLALLATAPEHALLKVFALHMLLKEHIHTGEDISRSIDVMVGKLSEEDKERFDSFKGGDLEVIHQIVTKGAASEVDKTRLSELMLKEAIK